MSQTERERPATPSDPARPARAEPVAGASAARLKGVGRGSTVNLVGAAVMALTTFVMTVVVTRGLDRTQAGIFFSATALFLLATSLGQLGSNTALVYFVARSREPDQAHRIHAYVRTALRAVLMAAVVMSAALLVLAVPVARLVAPDNAEEVATYLRVLALFIPFAGFENVVLAATRGLGSMRHTVVIEQIARTLVQLALVAASVWLLQGAGLGWAWAIGYVPAALLAGRAWRRMSRQVGVVVTGERGGADALRRDYWRFAIPRALASVGQQAIQRLDILLIAGLSGPVAAAIYTASTRFLVAGQMVNRAISTAVQPRLSEMLARGDREATNHLYRVSTGWLTLLTWPVFLSLVVYGERLMAVFGKGYDAGGLVLDILSVSMLWAMACGMVDMVLNMAGRTSWNLVNVAIAFALNIGLDLWLIPRHSYVGAAIGWAVAIVASNTLALTQVAVSMRLHPFGRTTILSLGLPVLAFLVLPLGLHTLLGHSPGAVLLGLAVSGVVYVGMLWWARGRLELMALLSHRRAPGRARRAEGGGA